MAEPVKFKVSRAVGVKCPRCWHIHAADQNFGHTQDDIAANPELANEHLCNRCVEIILEHFPQNASVPHILANLQSRNLKREDNPEYGHHN